MDGHTATSYFRILFKMLMRIQVTDEHGLVLSLDEGARRASDLIRSLRSFSSKALLVGNGGSAAIAAHLHNDLCKAVGVRAMVCTEPPLLTAFSNDDGYRTAFEQTLELWADAGDLLVAISSSGSSENILRAVRVALERRCTVLTMSGFREDNTLRRLGHLNFWVPSEEYGYVETTHAALAHFLTDAAMVTRAESVLEDSSVA